MQLDRVFVENFAIRKRSAESLALVQKVPHARVEARISRKSFSEMSDAPFSVVAGPALPVLRANACSARCDTCSIVTAASVTRSFSNYSCCATIICNSFLVGGRVSCLSFTELNRSNS